MGGGTKNEGLGYLKSYDWEIHYFKEQLYFKNRSTQKFHKILILI
jgi:hypothetical protein